MPLIIPSNSISAGGYVVDNSLRFNDGDDPRLKIANPTAGVRTKGTFSTWFKRCTNGAVQYFFSTWNNATDGYSSALIYLNSDKLHFNNYLTATGSGLHTNLILPRLFRDNSAFYSIVCSWDTTLGTSTDRVKIYVNGVRETNFTGTVRFPVLNEQLFFQIGGTANPQHIGYQSDGGDRNFDGYLAETVYVEGTALAADSFGEFDEDSGIWKPIDVSELTFGDEGFYLDYEDSSALGADVSGNSNNFAVTNLAAIDQTTDTPTNNFATMNPLIPSNGVFSEGNTTVTTTSSSWCTIGSTYGVTSGKWYWEVKADLLSGSTSSFYTMIGFVRLQGNSSDIGSNTTSHLGSNNGVGIYSANGNLYYPSSSTSYGSGYQTSGTIIGISLDLTNNYAYWSIDGTWQNSGDPESGATGTGGYNLSSFADGSFISPASSVQNYSSSNKSENEYNFGSPPFAISSGNTDGNGYGNFEYAVPSGYLSLCTSNLSEVLG